MSTGAAGRRETILLNPAQKTAAERLGQDVCVVAGPGSGKTRVLTERFCWLVREKQVPPDRILAITFTEKATTNIKQRLVAEFRGDPARRQQIERAYVSTIHGFCARLLREYAVAAGVDVDFRVLDEARSQPLLRQEADKALDELYAERAEETRRLLEALYVSNSPFGRQPDLAGGLIAVYEALRLAGRGVGDLELQVPETGGGLTDVIDAVTALVAQPGPWTTENRRRKRAQMQEWTERARRVASTPLSVWHFRILSEFVCNRQGLPKPVSEGVKRIVEELVPAVRAHLLTRYFAPLRALLIEALRRMDAGYRARKRELAALDFSDLEELVLKLLSQRPELRLRLQQKFDYILMDELQDTNRLQWRILDLVRRPGRFFAVGDINQSIYGFRHADPEVFREYRRQIESNNFKIDVLTENYRSRDEILKIAGFLLGAADGIELHQLVARKEFPPGDGPAVEVIVAWGEDAADAARKEGRWIARRIRELERAAPGDFRRFAVLARTREALKPIADALREFSVPCLIAGSRTLLESREVRDLTGLLAVLANPEDEISLAGVLRSPLVGVGDETLFRLKLAGGLWAGIGQMLSPGCSGSAEHGDLERLRWFAELVGELRANRDAVTPDRLLVRVIDESGYEAALDEQGRANLVRFLARLRELSVGERRPLAELLDQLRQLREAASEAEAPPQEAANAVQLMTVHGAKGLEFPVVFVSALQKGGGGNRAPVSFTPEDGLGVRWCDPSTGDAAPDTACLTAERRLKEKEQQEGNRLFYVAMTRAEERLILTWAAHPTARRQAWAGLVDGRLNLSLTGPAERDEIINAGPGHTAVRLRSFTQEPVNDFPAPPGVAAGRETVLKPPALSAQHDSAVAVTELSEFVACPRKYYLAHYLRLQPRPLAALFEEDDEFDAYMEDRSRPAAASIGIQVHQMLAGIRVDHPDEEARRLVERFRASGLAKRIEAAARVEREFDFVIEVEDLVLRGQIDAWFEEHGAITVLDYKTDDFDPASEPARLEPYALQLRLYALALEKLTGKLPSAALLHFLRREKTVPVSVNAAVMDETRGLLRRFRRAQDRLAFPVREGEHCARCRFHPGLCPAGGGGVSASR